MRLFHVYATCLSEGGEDIEFRVEADTEEAAFNSASRQATFWDSNLLFDIQLTELLRSQSWHVKFADGDDPEETISFAVLAYDDDDAIMLADREAKEQPYLNVSTFLDVCRARGGRRPGAGRNPENKPKKTVVKRVPVEMADKLDKIDSLLHLIKDWEQRSADSPETSPRWERCREMLSEISELLGE